MNVKCFRCGIVHNCNFCPNCGAPARPPQSGPVQKKQGMSAGAIVGLTFLGILVFIILVGIIGISMYSRDTTTSYEGPVLGESKHTPKPSLLQKVTDTTPEQEKLIKQILSDCNIEVSNITRDEMLDDMNKEGEKGYRITHGEVKNIILYLNPDKTVNIIRYADNDLYADGEIKSTISDYIITLDEASRLQTSCEEAIKTILKSPSTADFPGINKWSMWKEDGKIYIQSYVDAQNSFGAELRSEFQFILSIDDYSVESLIFEGEEYMK